MNRRLACLIAVGVAAAVVGISVGVVSAQTAPTFVPGFNGYIYKHHSFVRVCDGCSGNYSSPRFDVFVDTNGCEYIVVRDIYNSGISMTPRINSGTKQPHCRARR